MQNYYSPYDIWPDAPLKAAAFLQTLDDNTNASDGIKIPATISGDAATVTGEIIFDASLDLSSNTVVTALRNAHGSNPAVVAETAAETNMRSGIIEAAATKFKRHYNPAGTSLASVVNIGIKEVEVVDLTSNNTSCVATDGKLSSTPCVASLSAKFKYDTETSSAQTWTAYVGTKTKVGPFELYGEYITQHAYFVNVVAAEDMDEEVSFVVVEKGATAPALSSVDEFARHTRRFVYGDAELSTRPVYIAWKANLKLATYKDFVKNKNKIAYDASTHDWVLTAGKDYELYIFKGSTSYTHSFTTLDYKTTLADYVAALPGARNQIPYNTGLDLISAKGSVERKEAEPMVYNVLFGPGYVATPNILVFFGVSIDTSCSSGICGTLTYGPLLYYGTGTMPVTTISGVAQADWLYFVANYNDDGTLKTLTSPVTLEARYGDPFKSSMMTYKTVSE